jgi:hypothetical protein
LQNYVKVTHVVYTHDKLYTTTKEIEQDLIDRRLVKLTDAFARDEATILRDLHKKFLVNDIETVLNTEENRNNTKGTLLQALCHDYPQIKGCDLKTRVFPIFAGYQPGNFELNRTLNKVGPKSLRIFVGMPVIITDNLVNVPLNASRTDTSSSLPKNTQGVIKSFNLNPFVVGIDGSSLVAPEIVIQVNVESNGVTLDGSCFHKPVQYVITPRLQRCVVDIEGRAYNFSRMQFPLKSGLCISWTLVQGLTIPNLCLDIIRNDIIYNEININLQALWYVTLSRVRNLQNILITRFPGPNDKNNTNNYKFVKMRWKFFNMQNRAAVDFEKKFIKLAQTRFVETEILKARSQIQLLEHMNNSFSSAKNNFLSATSELAEVHTNLAYICIDISDIIKAALTDKPTETLFPPIRNLLSNQLNTAFSAGEAQSVLLAKEVSNSLPLQQCLSWLEKFCKSEFDIRNDLYFTAAKLITFEKVISSSSSSSSSSSTGGRVGLSTSPSASKLSFEFRYLRSKKSIRLPGICEEDILVAIYEVLDYIVESANQVIKNPIKNPLAFVEVYRSLSKRPRVYESSDLKSAPKLIGSFKTKVQARFLGFVTLSEYYMNFYPGDDAHPELNGLESTSDEQVHLDEKIAANYD